MYHLEATHHLAAVCTIWMFKSIHRHTGSPSTVESPSSPQLCYAGCKRGEELPSPSPNTQRVKNLYICVFPNSYCAVNCCTVFLALRHRAQFSLSCMSSSRWMEWRAWFLRLRARLSCAIRVLASSNNRCSSVCCSVAVGAGRPSGPLARLAFGCGGGRDWAVRFLAGCLAWAAMVAWQSLQPSRRLPCRQMPLPPHSLHL
mmetsp:Transcript_102010/g.176085  ORF Transcript_102010/g.176085 Transcript_102010/m.176085 type:complete len:201 (+) Transcript_102010:1075-1677(+)